MDEDDGFIRGPTTQRPRSRFMVWLDHVWTQRKLSYVSAGIVLAALCWWIKNPWPLAFALLAYIVLYRIMRYFSRKGATIVIECRLQGQKIECDYFFPKKGIIVPSSRLAIFSVPNARRKDFVVFGDKTPPVPTGNILVCDYFEPQPNGDILIVCQDDPNFSNFAGIIRANPELAKAMELVGDQLASLDEFKSMAIQMHREGRASKNDLMKVLGHVKTAQSHIMATPAARRDIWQHYQYEIPRLRHDQVMMAQHFPEMVTMEAAKFLHIVHDHPFGRAIMERISKSGAPSVWDLETYPERVRRLQEDGAAGPNEMRRIAPGPVGSDDEVRAIPRGA